MRRNKKVFTTVVTHEYFQKARVMLKSFLRHNKGYDVVIFADEDIGMDGVKTISINQPRFQREGVTQFERIEMIRAQAHLELFEKGYKYILYSDSDIYFTAEFPRYRKSMFTPHQTDSIGKCNPRWIMDDGFINIGIYWLVNDEATKTFLKILDDMSKKRELGYNLKPPNLKAYWQQCLYNHLPWWHKDYILSDDDGINAAWWNIEERGWVEWTGGKYIMGKSRKPLVCYHFSHWVGKELVSSYKKAIVLGVGTRRLYNEYEKELEKEKSEDAAKTEDKSVRKANVKPKTYILLCPFGKKDCIGDPAYILFHYPKWYKEMYGDMPPEEVVKTECPEYDGKSKDCPEYDDEDK